MRSSPGHHIQNKFFIMRLASVEKTVLRDTFFSLGVLGTILLFNRTPLFWPLFQVVILDMASAMPAVPA